MRLEGAMVELIACHPLDLIALDFIPDSSCVFLFVNMFSSSFIINSTWLIISTLEILVDAIAKLCHFERTFMAVSLMF